jgi:hypothetical protein
LEPSLLLPAGGAEAIEKRPLLSGRTVAQRRKGPEEEKNSVLVSQAGRNSDE